MTAGAAPALASAAAYGVCDFAGGLLARRIDLRVVAVAGRFGGLADVGCVQSSASFSGRRTVNSVSALRISSSRLKYTPQACSAMIP